ncbi:unnamed protein product [Malus baccata var. baccata]
MSEPENEFRLSQTYHEGLHKLQVKEYKKAAELLESVLKDPLIENAQVSVDDSVSYCHLLQLRFGFRHHPIICAILGLGVQFSNPHRRNQSLVEF